MGTTNPIEFLLNTSTEGQQDQVVSAPAYSLTKVLASAAIIIGPLATLLVDKLSKINFSAGQIVALAIGLLGFLAITASADVLARSIAANSAEKAAAADAERGNLIRFDTPIDGHHVDGEDNPDVKILGFIPGAKPKFLIIEDGKAKWLSQSNVTLG